MSKESERIVDANHLSKRLQRLADWVQPGAHLLDIGSDHAYLPVHLTKQQRLAHGIAGEITEGPYQRSVEEVHTEGFDDTIEVRLGDGFEVLTTEDEIDVAVMAGMGGELIAAILDRALAQSLLPKEAKLILQPNRKASLVREWLMNHDYTVLDEGMVYDGGKYYEMIHATPTDEGWRYEADELLLGHFTAENDPDIYQQYWEREYQKTKKILSRIDASNHPASGEKQRAYAEMIERHFDFGKENS